MEFPEEFFDFVKAHCGDDPTKLRLRFHGDSRPWIPSAINNIAALRKKRKFRLNDGTDFTPKIIPLELSAQQATSAQVAMLHSGLAKDSLNVLDMTFGLGMDARFLAMNPARHILGFDLREELVDAARVNFIDFPNVEIRKGDSIKFLEGYEGKPFDMVFIDPARRGNEGERLYNLHDCQPDLIGLLPQIKRKSHRLMAKLSPMLDVTRTIRDLPGIGVLHIVEEGNECKELLAVIDFSQEATTTEIIVDRLVKGENRSFSFTIQDERGLTDSDNHPSLLFRMPYAGEYLSEPSAATMKAAPFNLLSARFDARMLHPNTHLYISPVIHDSFPGATYTIEQVWPLTSSNLKLITRSVDKADIAIRNLKGFTPDIMRKRLKIKPGGDRRLYAATVATPGSDVPVLILTGPTGK